MFSIYWSYLKTTLALQLQYRVAMSIWMIGRLLEPTVYLVVWTTVAEAKGGSVGGYSAADFAAYYIVLTLVVQFTFTWIIHEYEYRIRSGELSAVLLKPIHPIHSDIADNIGYKVLTSVIIFPAAGFLYWMFDPVFNTNVTLFGYFVVSMVLACFLRFLLEWSIALVAFWTTRNEAINQMYFCSPCSCPAGSLLWISCPTGYAQLETRCHSNGLGRFPQSWSLAGCHPKKSHSA
jgi:ABC-2 type transport system permease protein